MRVISVILWILVSMFYLYIYMNQENNCCHQNNSIEQTVPAIGGADLDEKDVDEESISDEASGDTMTEEDYDQALEDDTEDESEDESEVTEELDEIKEEDTESINENKQITRLAEKVIISFPPNSNSRIVTPELEDYLEELSQLMRENSNTIDLVGFTDSGGNREENIQLGLQRAQSIKDLLVQKGVPANSINVSSKGPEDPIASNATLEGRNKNRRVELTIK